VSGETVLTVAVEAADCEVGGLLVRPPDARALYVLAHGAGAGMRHAFMTAVAEHLAGRRIATLRYEFPYMAAGRRYPDRAPRLVATVRAAVEAAREAAGDLPLIAGGKSMGGRMTSTAQAEEPLPGVRALAFLGFPLHPPARPGVERAAHLAHVRVPMLFVQGTRDTFARPDLLAATLAGLPLARLHEVAHADHGFGVLKRSGRTPDDVLDEIANVVAGWVGEVT